MPIFPLKPRDFHASYSRYSPTAFIFSLFPKKDIEKIYQGMMQVVEKPKDISNQRFEKIIRLKAKIFYIFLNEKIILDKIFDELEKSVAKNIASIGFTSEVLKEKRLNPREYIFQENLICDKRVKEISYHPIITKEILQIKYPIEFLAVPLKEQLQKNNINIPTSREEVELFSNTEGWFLFAGIVPNEKARNYTAKGQIFIDAPGYANTDNRHHGPYGHAIQEYLISKLIEWDYLGDLSVLNEKPITELELLKADAWKLNGEHEYQMHLFDIMRERVLFKSKLINYYPEYGFGFTSPEFLNQYLMLNPRFPCVSSFLFHMYAVSSLNYFSINSKIRTFSDSALYYRFYKFFKKVIPLNLEKTKLFKDSPLEHQLTVMNTYWQYNEIQSGKNMYYMKLPVLTVVCF